ncbi:GNAT family N-acetyltransferase [Deinococcus sp. PESE-13]
MPHRPYRDEADLTLLLRWLSDHAPTTFMHPGDLVWWLYQNMGVDPRQALELFFDGEAGGNELQGFSYCDGSWSVLQGLPDLPAHVWDEMVAAAVTRAGDKLTVQPHEWDTPQLAALKRAGFALTDNRMIQLVREVQPSDLAAVALPAGFRFADMSRGEVSAEDRVKVHQDVWHPSKVTLEAYGRLQAAPLYRPDLDVMVRAPSGEIAAYALGWLDPGSRTGLMEPVGTRTEFRRRGLGKSLIREVTRRFAALGAEKVTIGSYEKNVAAVALYQSAGYAERGFWVDWEAETAAMKEGQDSA